MYLGTETRRVFSPDSVPAATHDHLAFESVEQVLACTARYGLHEHPLFRDAQRLLEIPSVVRALAANILELLTTTIGGQSRGVEPLAGRPAE